MGIYYGEEIYGIRILKENNENGDFKVIYEYCGSEWLENFKNKKKEFEKDEIVIQVLKSATFVFDNEAKTEMMWVLDKNL